MSKPKNWLVIGGAVAIPLTESVYISQKDFKDAVKVKNTYFSDSKYQFDKPSSYPALAEIVPSELIADQEKELRAEQEVIPNELETAPQYDEAKADTTDSGSDAIF